MKERVLARKITTAGFVLLAGVSCMPELPEYQLTQEYHHCGTPDGKIPPTHLVYVANYKRDSILGIFQSTPKQYVEDLGIKPDTCPPKT